MLYDVNVVVVTEQHFLYRVEADTRTNAKKVAAAGNDIVSKTEKTGQVVERITPIWASEVAEPAATAAS